MFSTYYHLTKPGIIRGNVISLTAGFIFASTTHFKLSLYVATVVGTSLIIASGSVFNNYLDRHIDKQMDRTKNRAIASGRVSVNNAVAYASILGIAGIFTLAQFVNLLTATIGIFGLFAYVVVYGIAKRKSIHGTLVGTISGATPPLAGYTAVTGHVDGAAVILFLILVFWQMPHFYAIAMYRKDDYARAGLPVITVVKGMKAAKIQIFVYIAGLGIICSLLTVFGFAGYYYLAICTAAVSYWFIYGVTSLRACSDEKWARKMFGMSLVILLVVCSAISLGAQVP